MKDPKIYLAVDNCFASKRWTEPSEWADIVRSIGLHWVEASADTECDPLYMGPDYIKRWADKVINAGEKTGVRVANIYSGHGTYATLGLAHTDPEVRSRFLHDWLEPMAVIAAYIGSGLGFFCHAFSDSVLQSPERYAEFKDRLFDDLASLSAFCEKCGCNSAGVEQMYSPHQIPWTVDGAKELLREVNSRSGSPFYITVDVGHQSGQRRFLRPNREYVREMLMRKFAGDRVPELWLGPQKSFDIFDCASDADPETVDRILREAEGHDYMFAEHSDGDTYRWLSELASASPIIHLQQTDGVSSSHLPFTEECNTRGIIEGGKLLRSIAESYSKPDEPNLPPKPDKVFLTLEMFTGTAAINRAQLQKMADSVLYWRRFIPEDGMNLSELTAAL